MRSRWTRSCRRQRERCFRTRRGTRATMDRHLYFIPHRLMWQAMIYNRVEVPNPPANWDELERFAREHPGKLALKGARYEGAICDVMPFVWTAGGSECTPDSPDSVRALDFLRQLAPELNDETAMFREMSVLEAQARGSVWIHFNWPFAMGYLHAKGLAPSVNLSSPIPAGPEGQGHSARRRLPCDSEIRTSSKARGRIHRVSVDRRYTSEIEPRPRMVWKCGSGAGKRRCATLRRLHCNATVRAGAPDGRLLRRSQRPMAACDSCGAV